MSAAARPLVGITTYVEDARWGPWQPRRAALLPESYVRHVCATGGVPVLLPPQPARGARTAVAPLAALILSGGPDIDPPAYGARRAAQTLVTRPDRDRWDLALLQEALAADLPVLGVCRGMQLLNVSAGGDLVQHLPATGALSQHRPGLGTFGRHRVRLAAGSRVAEALGDELEVMSYHHQGIDQLGEGVQPVGWADDGVVEAVELAGRRFAVGVLWHPEEHEDGRIFQALLAA